jgi:hypothetical protein
MAASCLCRPRKYIVNSDWNNRGIPYTHVSQTVGTTFGELSKKIEKNTRKIRLTGSLTNSTSDFVLKGRGFKLRRKCKKSTVVLATRSGSAQEQDAIFGLCRSPARSYRFTR